MVVLVASGLRRLRGIRAERADRPRGALAERLAQGFEAAAVELPADDLDGVRTVFFPDDRVHSGHLPRSAVRPGRSVPSAEDSTDPPGAGVPLAVAATP